VERNYLEVLLIELWIIFHQEDFFLKILIEKLIYQLFYVVENVITHTLGLMKNSDSCSLVAIIVQKQEIGFGTTNPNLKLEKV